MSIEGGKYGVKTKYNYPLTFLYSNLKNKGIVYNLLLKIKQKLNQNTLIYTNCSNYIKKKREFQINKGLGLQKCEKDIYNNYRGRWSK